MVAIQNNFKLALRSFWRNRSTNALNITGLTLGVLASIIIFLTVKYELGFDGFHQNNHEIYRVTNNYYYPTFTMHVGNTPDPMAEALKTDFPSFKRVVPIHSSFNSKITVENESFDSDIIYCSGAFLELFDYYNQTSQWIHGNPVQVLNEVNKTVLTEETAILMFGSSRAAMGQVIELNQETPLEIGAIIKNPPNNTSYPFEQLVSHATYAKSARSIFGSVNSTTTFVQISDEVEIATLKPALDAFNEKYMEAAWGEDFVSMALQPLSEIHFDERFESDNYTTSKTYLWALGIIGFFLILIACINFINLATATAINRTKEIGMRKILGSTQKGIISQFMGEAFLLASLAIILGTLGAQLTFPYFSELTSLNVGNEFYYSLELIVFISGLLLFIPLAMGLYPAFTLASFQSIGVLQSKTQKVSKKGWTLRQILIAFQLVISQILIIGAVVVAYQMKYFENKDLGFNKESVLIINFNRNDTPNNQLTLQQKIQSFPFIQQTSLSSTVPMTGHTSSTSLTSQDSEVQDRFNTEFIFVDNAFIETLNLELLAGKKSVTPLEHDTLLGFIANETLINRLNFGMPQNALGKRINVNGQESRIIGVVKDFHTVSLHSEIKPLALVFGAKNYSVLSLKFQTEDTKNVLASLESSWKSVFPGRNFDYYFLDEEMRDIYENEMRFSKIVNVFTLISIIIACIGLVGLSAFSVVNRFREIGIRKVLGASISNILMLISKEFLLLTIISFLISLPIAMYLASNWLNSFAYRIDLEWWMVLLAGILTILVTLITVSLQSIRAVMVNPVDTLKRE